MMSKLTKDEKIKRDFILNGPMWSVIFSISMPLVIYNSLNHYFGFFDTMMVAHIGREVVSAVAYMNQIQIMLAALGTGLALGGGIIIARHYGAGDFEEAKKYSNVVMLLAITISVLLIIFIVPFTKPILRFANTPVELIEVGATYFKLQVIMVVSIFINNVYIAVEKAKGNTKRILYFNLMVFVIKLVLTLLFVYVFKFGINMVAFASIIAQSSLTIAGIYNLRKKDNILRLELSSMRYDLSCIKIITAIAFPIFVQKFVFSFGKVVVNSMSVFYGSMTVGALGISNKLGGTLTTPPMGVQDGEATIISQNLGNKNVERAIDTFKKSLLINIGIGVVGLIMMALFMDFFINIFAGDDVVFAEEIRKIFKYERIAAITLAISAAVMGFLYGFGYTKLALLINTLRLFAFRIPTLYILIHYTNLGSESVGIAMLVSNGFVGVAALIVSVIVIKKIRKEGDAFCLER